MLLGFIITLIVIALAFAAFVAGMRKIARNGMRRYP
jgi:hypothetical protein